VNPAESFHGNVIHPGRVRRLAGWFARLLPPGAQVLDVGTGDGRLAADIAHRRPDLHLQGVEIAPREDCAIAVTRFDGLRLPFQDEEFDAIMFADVLHHAERPVPLLGEAVRVAGKAIVIKDHLLKGLLAGPTLRLMDQVGNRRFGVPVRADYWTEQRWQDVIRGLRLGVASWNTRLRLYPWWLDWWFGRSLHFIASLTKDNKGEGA
jgi:SAM-dependent methyltransferase